MHACKATAGGIVIRKGLQARQAERSRQRGRVGGVRLQRGREGLLVAHPGLRALRAHHVRLVEHQQQRQLRLVQDAARLPRMQNPCSFTSRSHTFHAAMSWQGQ